MADFPKRALGIFLPLPDICGAILSRLNKELFRLLLQHKFYKILLNSWFINPFEFLAQFKLVKMLMKCPAAECGRPFQTNRFSAEFFSAQERGKIICPHCGMVVWRDSDSIFLTHALSNEQELHFSEMYMEDMAKKCA